VTAERGDEGVLDEVGGRGLVAGQRPGIDEQAAVVLAGLVRRGPAGRQGLWPRVAREIVGMAKYFQIGRRLRALGGVGKKARVVGGRREMRFWILDWKIAARGPLETRTSNIARRTSNVEPKRSRRERWAVPAVIFASSVRRWAFDVGCSAFVFILSA